MCVCEMHKLKRIRILSVLVLTVASMQVTASVFDL